MPEPTRDELNAAIALLEGAGPEYSPLLHGGPPSGFLKVGEVAKLTGWSEHTTRNILDSGAIRGAILYPHGWSIPWSGLVCYIADRYRETLKRTSGA
jgi:hypothetical protein